MPKYAFFQGKFVPIEDAKISIMTHAFNYGTGCFEGIRAYWNEEDRQLYAFRLPEHFERLHRSCRILRISLPYSPHELCEFTVELLRRAATLAPENAPPLAPARLEGRHPGAGS